MTSEQHPEAIGVFDDSKREFVLRQMFTERACVNYLWNDRTLASINQFGCGESWILDERGRRVHLAKEADFRRVHRDNRLIFITDDSTGEFWAANRNFKKEPFDAFYTEVGLGYSTVHSEYKNIRTEFQILIPHQGLHECWQVTVRNTGSTNRMIRMTAFAETARHPEFSIASTRGFYDDRINGVLMSYAAFDQKSKLNHYYFAGNESADSYETTMLNFKGWHNLISDPAALYKESLSSADTDFDIEMAAALQYPISLVPGESRTFRFIFGVSSSAEAAAELQKSCCTAEYFDAQRELLRTQYEELISKVQFDSPDPELNSLINIWLKRQIDLGKSWGRVYAKGFRDIMQDVTAVVSFDTQAAAEKIKECLQHQYENGNTLRQWAPVDHHPYRDGSAWIVSAVSGYIKETGDLEFLNLGIPYYKSAQAGTVLDHIIQGLDFLFSETGARGLCLWGGGDWNDSINNAGLQNKGESVWLSEAAVASAVEFAELLDWLEQPELANEFRKKADVLKSRILENGWNEDHFIYGITDWDEPVGSYESEQANLFLNPQCWAVLAGIVDGEDAAAVMDLVERELNSPFGYVQCKPSFSKPDDHIGRLSYLRPGCFENGSVYNHGVAFKIAADCKLGRGDLAYETLKKMLGSNPDNPSAKSGMEPYAITNMFIGPECETRAGVSTIPWITGTAGWVFRAAVEFICGIQATYSGLVVRPCLPSCWEKVNVRRAFRGSVYDINILNPDGLPTGVVSLTIDGKHYTDEFLPLFEDGQVHVIIAEVKKEKKTDAKETFDSSCNGNSHCDAGRRAVCVSGRE